MKRKIRKIALINPKKPIRVQNPGIYDMFERNKNNLKPWFSPPLSLFVIAANTPEDIEVTIIDEHFETIDFELEFDLVGLTAMTQQALRAYEIAQVYKQKNVPVVMGGYHATVLPDEALLHVDSVFLGESELLWKTFLNDFEQGTTKRIYSTDEKFDMSNSTLPRYDLLNYKHFKEADSYYKFLPVQATRGCPHDCTFCVVSKFYGKKIRKKPIKQVLEDIKYMQHLNFEGLFFFVDDNLFVDRSYAKELLKELMKLKIKYFAQSDVKVAEDKELLELAYKSGCLMVFIGFESTNIASLQGLNSNNWKMKQVQKYKEAIKRIQENGIVVFGAFITGFKNDDLLTFENIKNFVLQNNIPGQFTLLTPLPGSTLYDQLKNEGRLFREVFWDQCSCMEMTFKHDYINKKEADNKIAWLYDEIFANENVLKRNQHMMQIYKNLPPRWN